MNFISLLFWIKPATVRCHRLFPVPTFGFSKTMHAGFLHKLVHMMQLLTHPLLLNLCCFQTMIPAAGDFWRAPSIFYHFGKSLGISLDICRFFSSKLLGTWMVCLLEASSPELSKHWQLSTRMMSWDQPLGFNPFCHSMSGDPKPMTLTEPASSSAMTPTPSCY